MAIHKKSLISTLRTTKKANVAKDSLGAGAVSPVTKGTVTKGAVQKGPVQKGLVQKGLVQKGPVQKGPVQKVG
jgi:hypothetical protein